MPTSDQTQTIVRGNNQRIPRMPNGVIWAKALVFGAGLVPVARLMWRFHTDELGANPIEFITHSTGIWTLVFLLATLTITPLRKITGLNQLIRLRRMLGLFAFFYASLHLATYVILDQFFDFHAIAGDIVKRPYITMGFFAFTLMVPLAATSTRRMVARLGRRWQLLHRLVYVSAVAGVIHFLWLVKADIREPAIYACVLAFLLGYRVLVKLRPAPSRSRAPLGHRFFKGFGVRSLQKPRPS